MRFVRGQHRILRHRVELAQMLVGGRAIGEQVLEMRRRRRDGGRPLVADGDDRGLRIVAVGAHFAPEHGADPRLIGLGHRLEAGVREQAAQRDRFAMQPVRAPVRRDIAAMAPDRALLHPAGRLPDRLAALDLLARIDESGPRPCAPRSASAAWCDKSGRRNRARRRT